MMDKETKMKLTTILDKYGMVMQKKQIMKACLCGSETFILQGFLCVNTKLIDGKLTIGSDIGSRINKITCTECEIEYEEKDFKAIDFRAHDA